MVFEKHSCKEKLQKKRAWSGFALLLMAHATQADFPVCCQPSRQLAEKAMAREQAKSDKWVYLVGDQPCYVDFLALNAMRTMNFCFFKERVALGAKHADAAGFLDAVALLAARPKVSSWLNKALPVLYDSVSSTSL